MEASDSRPVEATHEPELGPERPDLLREGVGRLSRMERLQIRAIRRSFEPGVVDSLIRWCQRSIGSSWIHHCTKHLRHVYGLERLPELTPERSFICVSNHRSFFDLYVVTAELVRRGLPQRIVFPVRSNFFYDSALGFFVNGVMSFFAMYPPIFRAREQVRLNRTSLDELAWLLRRGGVFAGIHPEGRRNPGEDPYSLLSAQRGTGQVIHAARVPVIPVFVNGLLNDLRRQVWSNFDRSGTPVLLVFGAPIDFGDLLLRPASPRVYQAVADRTVLAIAELGQEEKRLRSERARALP